MNDDTIADLKQFIATTISQHTAQQNVELLKNIRGEMRQLEAGLTQKMDNLSESIAEAIDTGNDLNHERFEDHERRIKHLETQTA